MADNMQGIRKASLMLIYKYIPTQQVESKKIEANNNPQAIKEEIPKLKPADKRRIPKVRDDMSRGTPLKNYC